MIIKAIVVNGILRFINFLVTRISMSFKKSSCYIEPLLFFSISFINDKVQSYIYITQIVFNELGVKIFHKALLQICSRPICKKSNCSSYRRQLILHTVLNLSFAINNNMISNWKKKIRSKLIKTNIVRFIPSYLMLMSSLTTSKSEIFQKVLLQPEANFLQVQNVSTTKVMRKVIARRRYIFSSQ